MGMQKGRKLSQFYGKMTVRGAAAPRRVQGEDPGARRDEHRRPWQREPAARADK